MKKLFLSLLTLALLFLPVQMRAEGAAIKVEFSGTSMTIELSQQPKIVTEDGKLVLKTSSMSVALTLPCKVTPIGGSNTAIDKVVIRNNDDNADYDYERAAYEEEQAAYDDFIASLDMDG